MFTRKPRAPSEKQLRRADKTRSRQTGQFDIRNPKKMCICGHSLAVHAPKADIQGNRPCEVTKHIPALKHFLPGGKCDCDRFYPRKK